jgi:hypothetical protein
MANEKTYSAHEAALAVLAKTQELLNKSEFMKAEKMKKDGSIQSGIAAAGGGGNTPINSGVVSSLGGSFGKNEKVCMDHADHDKMDKCVHKSECVKCMGKSEYTELYASLAKMEEFQKGEMPSPKPAKERDPASPEAQGAGNKEQPSSPAADPSKPIERDHSDFETKPGHSNAPDHREAPQASPQANPKEQHEGNNPEAGSIPGNGIHKLMYFCGHSKAKKNMKKGIALG